MRRATKLVMLLVVPLFLGCLATEVDFSGKTDIKPDGTIIKSGELRISASSEQGSTSDSSTLKEYYASNFANPDTHVYSVQVAFPDSCMAILHTAIFIPKEQVSPDYIHVGKDKTSLANHITLQKHDRWFFADYHYEETFADPIDTAKYFPIIMNQMAGATAALASSKGLRPILEAASAQRILAGAQELSGIGMMRLVVAFPDSIDRLTGDYEKSLEVVADTLAALSPGVVSPDSLFELLMSAYNAVWDTLMTNYPGIFGSFGIGDGDQHRFVIEVVNPGYVLSTNADFISAKTCSWRFDRQAFFAREKKLEVISRRWAWGKTFLTLAVIIFVAAMAFRPKKGDRAGSGTAA